MPLNRIKGLQQAINILRLYLKDGRLSGGYLFTGPEGVGKKLAALALAKAVNCEQGAGIDFCSSCPSCLKADKSEHPDIHVISGGEEDIKIEDIRILQRQISFRPYEGKSKVFILDNAHTLTAEASNALLKVLEEPPKHSLIILISDKPALLFKTIISRCKTVKFPPLERKALKEMLINDYGLKDDEAHFLAYLSEGRLGKSLRLKDTDIVIKKNKIIDAALSLRRQGFGELDLKEREDVREFLNILATWFRDIYLVKVGVAHQELIHFDRKPDLLKSMTRFTFTDLNGIMEAISSSLSYLDSNINSKLILYNLGAQIWKA